MPPSEMKPVIVGLNLLHLLVENRLAEFHSEVSSAFETVLILAVIVSFFAVGAPQ